MLTRVGYGRVAAFQIPPSKIRDGRDHISTDYLERCDPIHARHKPDHRLYAMPESQRNCPINSSTFSPLSPTSKANAQVFSISS